MSDSYRRRSQSMQTTEIINSTAREKIISMTNELLTQKETDQKLSPRDYEISLWANTEVTVAKFKRLFKYCSNDFDSRDNKYFNFTYDVAENLTSEHLPPLVDRFRKNGIHIPSKEEKEIIDFVKKHSGTPFTKNSKNEYDIHEAEVYHDSCIRLNESFTNYKIDKKSGEISGLHELNAAPAELSEHFKLDIDPLNNNL